MSTLLRAGEVLEEVAVFPLPGVVLFPSATLPLHIFEPRYKAMAEFVLRDNRLLSVVKLQDSPGQDDAGNPHICSVAGIGRVVEHHRHPDGRFDLLLVGLARVQLDELAFTPPFRRARAVVLESFAGGHGEQDVVALVAAATHFAMTLQRGGFAKDVTLPEESDPARLADLCAHRLIIDAEERQRVLETLDVGERLRACAATIATQAALLAPNVHNMS